MSSVPRALAALTLAAAIGGCDGCNDGNAPSAPASSAPADAAATQPPANAPGGGAQAAEADCFVIVDAEPDFGAPPLTVNFVTEIDCTSQPVTYKWDFGDGSTGGNDPKPSHVYAKAGDYVASVTVSAPDGGSGSDEIDITVDSDLSD